MSVSSSSFIIIISKTVALVFITRNIIIFDDVSVYFRSGQLFLVDYMLIKMFKNVGQKFVQKWICQNCSVLSSRANWPTVTPSFPGTKPGMRKEETVVRRVKYYTYNVVATKVIILFLFIRSYNLKTINALTCHWNVLTDPSPPGNTSPLKHAYTNSTFQLFAIWCCCFLFTKETVNSNSSYCLITRRPEPSVKVVLGRRRTVQCFEIMFNYVTS